IVDPMSEKALVDTIKAVIDKQYAENPDRILIAPGNYGRDFCRRELDLDIEKSVPVSNYIGEALDYIGYKGFSEILLVGHTGKLIKIAAGIMNTHSSYADGRMEVIGCHSAVCGADAETVSKILDCITTDDAFDLIADKPYYEAVKARIMERTMYHLNFRLKGKAKIETVMFTTDRRHMIKSAGADLLAEKLRKDHRK
ncbi:MAG: cobalt-precorrin-5B (C(1))-methyltransferase, partial [Emergencia sp.]|nr:cobalt-precorrin-5B (C(1))-methyltransferase [Emergencia sp.]